MATVIICNRESFEQGIKKFTQMCNKEGILKEARNRSHFQDPGAVRRLKCKAAKIKMNAGRIKKSL